MSVSTRSAGGRLHPIPRRRLEVVVPDVAASIAGGRGRCLRKLPDEIDDPTERAVLHVSPPSKSDTCDLFSDGLDARAQTQELTYKGAAQESGIHVGRSRDATVGAHEIAVWELLCSSGHHTNHVLYGLFQARLACVSVHIIAYFMIAM